MKDAKAYNILFIIISLSNRVLSISLVLHFLSEKINYPAYMLIVFQVHFLIACLYLAF